MHGFAAAPATAERLQYRCTQGAARPAVLLFALRYNSTVEAIVRTNHLANPNLICAGQRLCIP